MRAILSRQRLAADRHGREFAVCLFGCGPAAPLRETAAVLLRRSRGTDDIGAAPTEIRKQAGEQGHGFEPRRPALLAVLPDTSRAGGIRFAEDIARRLAAPLPWVVFHYDGRSRNGGDCFPQEPPDRPARREQEFQTPEPAHAAPIPAGVNGVHAARIPITLAFGGPSGDEPAPSVMARLAHPANGAADGRLLNGSARTAPTVADLWPTVYIRQLPWWKRLLDVSVAMTGLIALMPLLMIVGLFIRLDSPGPALFWQRRAGLGGRPFWIAKFRTMVPDAESRTHELRPLSDQDGPAFKLKRDPRVTRAGLLLRSTSIDELPQLWNVLRGEMTLVGPRPLPLEESAACTPWQSRRLDVTPGLTCIWQIHGRGCVSFEEWMRMDARYLRQQASRLAPVHDALLLLKTVPAMFLKRGY